MQDRRRKPVFAIGHGQLVIFALRLAKPLGWLGFLIGLVSFAGFQFDLEYLWRPLPGGLATGPWTSLALMLLALSLMLHDRGWARHLGLVLAALLGAIALTNLAEVATGLSLAIRPAAWARIFDREAAEGEPLGMGLATTAMLGWSAACLAARYFRHYRLAMSFALVAFGGPLVALLGYAFGIEAARGHMAVPTMLGGLALCFGLLCRDANRGWLKILLGPWIASGAGRQQIILINAGIFLIGLISRRLGLVQIDDASIVALPMLVVALVISATSISYHRIELAELRARWQLSHEAVHDGLTGILNRRGFLRQAEAALSALPAGAGALLMLDIDRFKRVNDEFGHAAGDLVLAAVARAARGRLRNTDLVGRVGGEEFAILLTAVRPGAGRAVAEALCHDIAALRFDVPGMAGGVTVSVGVAESGRAGETIGDLMIRADRALYAAKAAGRDRVEMAAG